MESGIYMITNIINNKKYIGSSKNIKRRKYEHFISLRNNKHKNKYLQFSFNKYKEEFFVFTILENCSIESLIDREKYWINIFQSSNTNKGYNLSIPMENGGYEMTNITKEKLRRITLNRRCNIKTEEEYQEWIKKRIEYKNRIKIDLRKKVLAFNCNTGELVKTFNSVSEIGYNNAYRVIDKPTKTYKGLTYVSEENYNTNKVYKKEYKEKKVYEKVGHFKGNKFKCINVETKEEIIFNNKFEAIQELNLSITGISKVLYGNRKSHKGYTFELLK